MRAVSGSDQDIQLLLTDSQDLDDNQVELLVDDEADEGRIRAELFDELDGLGDLGE